MWGGGAFQLPPHAKGVDMITFGTPARHQPSDNFRDRWPLLHLYTAACVRDGQIVQLGTVRTYASPRMAAVAAIVRLQDHTVARGVGKARRLDIDASTSDIETAAIAAAFENAGVFGLRSFTTPAALVRAVFTDYAADRPVHIQALWP